MQRITSAAVLGVLAILAGGGPGVAGETHGRIAIVRVPDGGIQPQATVDAQGVVHLIYIQGDPKAGDLDYVRSTPGHNGFSPPVRVNSLPGSVAVGTIRGGQIAIGRRGRVHVAWNGSGRTKEAEGMRYARSNEGGTAFEPERNLMKRTSFLDGGGTVAADGSGRVYVCWHAHGEGDPEGEAARRFWVARSTDDGANFGPEERALDRPTGACACCGTHALVDRRGDFYALFRAATGGSNRDMILVASKDQGVHYTGSPIHRWRLDACPMSSESLAEGAAGVLAAWETAGQVYAAWVDARTQRASAPFAPPGTATGRKHPSVAVNARGEVLMAWTEGTGWQRGGDLAWQVFDAAGKPTAERGRIEGGIPVWGLATVVARRDGGFTIIH